MEIYSCQRQGVGQDVDKVLETRGMESPSIVQHCSLRPHETTIDPSNSVCHDQKPL